MFFVNKTVTYTEIVNTNTSNSGGLVPASTTVKFVADCGKSKFFDQKFASCNSATATVTTPGLNGNAKYTINGPKDNNCSVTMIFTGLTVKSWNNQSMTCNFNDKVDIFDAEAQALNSIIQTKNNPESCSGPLMSIVQKTYSTL